jgi:ribosomal protein L11 methyltransferase
MHYYQYNFHCNPETTEILPALLEELPFDMFEETETGIAAYIRADDHTDDIEQQVNALKSDFDFTVEKIFIEAQNWNAVWESNFEPIVVDDFCGVRADFHPPTQNVTFDLVINPKMAFGTGHHETTYMMLQTMRNMPFEGKKVLDYGAGTGILAILAAKLGATNIDAVDNEYPAYEGTIENAVLNDVSVIESYYGTLEVIEGSNYDVILANINRNVILASLQTLYDKLAKGGTILFSGFIPDDKTLMLHAFEQQGLTVENVEQRGNWLCVKCLKNHAKNH